MARFPFKMPVIRFVGTPRLRANSAALSRVPCSGYTAFLIVDILAVSNASDAHQLAEIINDVDDTVFA